jgi:CheY-like chemotaxis protein
MHRILIVDDSHVLADVIAGLLAESGCDTRVAHTSDEALSEIEGWRPETILLDLGIVPVNGIELARRLRGQYGSALRLVALTAWSNLSSAQLEEVGFNRVLFKPASIDEILTAIHGCGHDRLQEAA